MADHVQRNIHLEIREDGTCAVRTQVVTTPVTPTGRHAHSRAEYTYEAVEFASVTDAARFASAITKGLAFAVGDVLDGRTVTGERIRPVV